MVRLRRVHSKSSAFSSRCNSQECPATGGVNNSVGKSRM